MNYGYKAICIDVQEAKRITEAAIAAAEAAGIEIAVAVVDRSGHLVSFLRTNQAPYMSIDIAINKAYSAASFSAPTSRFEAFLPKDSILRESILNTDRFTAFAGGIPILVKDQCLGAVGVSGATEEQDEACAQAGIDALFNS